jgi:hypothetical protein
LVLAYTGNYCVSGAGNSAVDGTYTFVQTGAWIKCPYDLTDSNAVAGSWISPCAGETINETYAQIRLDNTSGEYYNTNVIGIAPPDPFGINADGGGGLPVPTIAECASPPPPATTTPFSWPDWSNPQVPGFAEFVSSYATPLEYISAGVLLLAGIKLLMLLFAGFNAYRKRYTL